MVNPIGSGSPPPFSPNPSSNEMPPGAPLPPNDPWVKALEQMCPGIPQGEAMLYASRLRDNMFHMLQNEIKQDDARRQKEKQIEKEMHAY